MTVTLASSSENPNFLRQLRLFLEEICCDICRVHAVQHDGAQAEEVDVAREVDLGAPGAFADMLGAPLEVIETDINNQALQVVREDLALEALFRAEGLEVTEDDIDAFVASSREALAALDTNR